MKQKNIENITIMIIVLNILSNLLFLISPIIFNTIFIKLLGLVFLVVQILIIIKNKKFLTKILNKNYIIYTFFIFWNIFTYILLLRFIDKFGFNYMFGSFFAYNFYYFFILIYLLIQDKVNFNRKDIFFNRLKKYIYITAIISFLYAMYEILNNQLFIISFNIENRIKSFFLSGFDFGNFLAIVYSISLSSILFTKKKKIIDFIMVILSLIFVYFTFTRNIYILIIFITIICFLIKLSEKIKLVKLFLKFIPLILVGVILIYFSLNINLNNNFSYNSNNLSDITSMQIRIGYWENLLKNYFVDGSFINILFGFGLIQSDRYLITKGLIIDNSFIGIYLYQGIIMLILFLILYIKIWANMIKKINQLNYYEKSYIAIIGSFLATSIFNNFMYGNYYMVICIGLFIYFNENFSEI